MTGSSWRASARRFRSDLNAVADVNWWHPAWQALIWGSSLLSGSADGTEGAMQTYRSANGGPDSDTFMARPGPTAGTVTERVARAVVGAVAAVENLDRLQPRLPDQVLNTCLQWERGWLNPRRLSAEESRHVVLITPRGTFLTPVDRTRAEPIGQALCSLFGGDPFPSRDWLQPIDAAGREAVRAAVAVSFLDHGTPQGRHLHRFGWSPGGGPWLGLGETADLHLVSTCHRAVEGFGHAQLTECILNQVEAEAPSLAAVLGPRFRELGVTPFKAVAASPFPVPDLGWATRFLSGEIGKFVHHSYAMGRALQLFYRGEPGSPRSRREGFSPQFHVPVAPQTEQGRLQRDALIRHGLLSVGISEEGFEPLPDFRLRLQDWILQERRGEGLLTRLTVANCTSRLPRFVKLLLLRSRRRPRALLPPIETLAGRGRISSMRFAPGERPAAPLYAVAAPALFPTPRDPRGGQALTLIHHDAGCTITLVGSGLSSHREGAEAFLDLWLEQLEAARRADRLS